MEIAIIILFIIALILGAMLISQRITLKSENGLLREKLRNVFQEKELLQVCIKSIESMQDAKKDIEKFPKGGIDMPNYWIDKIPTERQQKTNRTFAKALNEKSERIRELERELSDTLSQLRQTNEIHTMANYTIIELKKELKAEKAKQKYFHSGANEIEQDLREKPKPKKGKK